jgi:rfaE bifunctional protein kinase chain/domain
LTPQPEEFIVFTFASTMVMTTRLTTDAAAYAASELSWIEVVLSRLPAVCATVFGDFCLDAYWWIDEAEGERSLETGLPVRRIIRQQYGLGGAGNVVANLIDLGVGHVRAIGVVGGDLFGGELLRLLRKQGVDTTGMFLLEDGWQTMVYAKPCRADEEEHRFDFGSFNVMPNETVETLLAELDRAAASSDIVVLNQQRATGISSPEIINRINSVIRNHPKTRFIVDARHHAELYQDSILKLNAGEARRVVGDCGKHQVITAQLAKEYASRLQQQTRQPIFLTRGEKGIVVADGNLVHDIPGIQIIDRTDPVGAGDTALAALAAVLGSGGDSLAAAKFANVAASITVRKLQTTGTVTPAEIRTAGEHPDYVYLPELADDFRQACYLEQTEIEVLESLPEDLRIQHAIFDHDGTISTLRQGWEQIMEPMMVRAVLGPLFDTTEISVLHRVQERVQQFIDKTTGVQTLVQMQGLVQMVQEFGFVPAEQILDAHGYKKTFNQELLAMVHKRVEKLERGELDPEDFQIKNVQRLLKRLHGNGVKLYLASGTDESDVRAEAEALRYAHLFEGRIFGAVGDVRIEAKKVVLERIINEHKLLGNQFVTFGDGPVEIRETRKRGGVCIGVASDEIRRFGLNLAKRARLIRAGAQVIIPDFSQLSSLLRLLRVDQEDRGATEF